jgi:XTP/dITP diphosphohydrolase
VRKFDGDRLVLATHNAGKLAELRDLIAPLRVAVASSGELGLPAPEETGATFEENAVLKARAACEASGLPALADDSGLEVAALGGRPGVHSARWASPDGDHAPAIARVLEGLEGQADRSARFACVLALAWPDGHVETARGEVAGAIAEAQRGAAGFGYDPVFVPDGWTRSFAEASREEKAGVSHRARALEAMMRTVFAR